MIVTTPVSGYLSRLAQRFDENLRTSPSDPTQKGWGQFIVAEHHSNQVGLHGTSAGLLVKLAANPNSTIDDGVVNYLTTQWAGRHKTSQKYFNQTVRLAFMILALAKPSDDRLLPLRNEAVAELLKRQHGDGTWGDWHQEDSAAQAPPRPETTAWVILALVRLTQDDIRQNIANAGRFLQNYALGFSRIDKEVDPLLIGAIMHALPSQETNSLVRASAVRLLLQNQPNTDLQIYFFDYILSNGSSSQVKRDYLCVPHLFSYCVASTSIIACAFR